MDKFTKVVLSILGLLVATTIAVVIIVNLTKKDDDYDVSMMHEVTAEDVLKMFEDGGTYVVLMGRENCDVCARLIPKMAEAQKQLNYITQYVDLLSIDFDSETWQALSSKLDMQSTQAISENQTGKKETNTYGYFVETYLMAPTVIIIKNGKQTGGFIGGVDATNLIGWLQVKISNDLED